MRTEGTFRGGPCEGVLCKECDMTKKSVPPQTASSLLLPGNDGYVVPLRTCPERLQNSASLYQKNDTSFVQIRDLYPLKGIIRGQIVRVYCCHEHTRDTRSYTSIFSSF